MESFPSGIKTRILILSDTHGDDLPLPAPDAHIDIVIHCGDLTEESKLHEFRASIDLLKRIDAPLKLVIAGNHDFTLDTPAFQKMLADAQPPLDDNLVKEHFGDLEEARSILAEAKQSGIIFLDEGSYSVILENGAKMTVFASPYTPSRSNWGFQYTPEQGHEWPISQGTDVVITHGPPKGILDRTDSRERAGSSRLFCAIAKARPRLHCFGHIHEGWGAKTVTWREQMSATPSHFVDIDNDRSKLIESLPGFRVGKFDTPDTAEEKQRKISVYAEKGFCSTSHCTGDEWPLRPGDQTLFVNAAIQGSEEHPIQLPWIVDIELPQAEESYVGQCEAPVESSAASRLLQVGIQTSYEHRRYHDGAIVGSSTNRNTGTVVTQAEPHDRPNRPDAEKLPC